MIHRMDPPADPTAEPMPDTIVPMLARLGPLPRDEERWAFEIKWDGVRAIATPSPGACACSRATSTTSRRAIPSSRGSTAR